jgi:hypothetical protein
VVFKKGIDNVDTVCVCRAPVIEKEFSGDLAIKREINCVCVASVKEILTEWLNADAVRKATDSDEQLSETKLEIQDISGLYEYTLEAGILFKGPKAIIPKILQKPVLEQGVEKYLDQRGMKRQEVGKNA